MRSKTVIKREAAEDYLYEFINTHSGLSIYEIAKKLDWSTGKVYDIVKTLEDSGLITTQKSEENGRIKKRVYPVSWKELLPEDVKEKL
ncbi:MAG: helix-turn-helix domain-containing protein [Archaeoglobaceae archaeon]